MSNGSVSRVIGKIFLSEEGLYPDGLLEDACDAEKASDTILQGLIKEEKRRDAELKLAVRRLEVWQEVFAKIEGVGETIAAGIIVAVGDIRRFATKAKLKKFLGAHVENRVVCQGCSANVNPLDLKMVEETPTCPKCGGVSFFPTTGRFPRKRVGTVANWHPRGRQALYLLAGQFVYRADSVWGLKFREYKRKFRVTHPDVICSTCNVPWDQCKKKTKDVEEVADAEAPGGKHTRKYGDGHIHKMAMWRTLSKFVEALYRDWWALEKRRMAAAPTAEEPAA